MTTAKSLLQGIAKLDNKQVAAPQAEQAQIEKKPDAAASQRKAKKQQTVLRYRRSIGEFVEVKAASCEIQEKHHEMMQEIYRISPGLGKNELFEMAIELLHEKMVKSAK